MSMPSSGKSRSVTGVIEMLRIIRMDILSRLYRGKTAFARDLKTLLNHLTIAEEIGDTLLIGEIEEVVSILYNEIGQFEEGANHAVRAFHAYKKADSAQGLARVQYHLGNLYQHLGYLDAALEAYQEGRELSESIGDTEAIMRMESQIGWVWLMKKAYNEAKVCFSLVVALTEYETWLHVVSLVAARRGFAELLLHMGDIPQAYQEVNHAELLASGGGLRVLQAQTYITRAHIAAQDPATLLSPHECWQRARQILEEYNNPVMLARLLMAEARYQYNMNDLMAARLYAEEALQIFEAGHIEGESTLTHQFLAHMGGT